MRRLDEELLHEGADLDAESLFVAHSIFDEEQRDADGEPRAYWLHTHGLAELGTLDFDILRPSPLITTGGYDTVPRDGVLAFLEEGPAVAGESHVTVCCRGDGAACAGGGIQSLADRQG